MLSDLRWNVWSETVRSELGRPREEVQPEAGMLSLRLAVRYGAFHSECKILCKMFFLACKMCL